MILFNKIFTLFKDNNIIFNSPNVKISSREYSIILENEHDINTDLNLIIDLIDDNYNNDDFNDNNNFNDNNIKKALSKKVTAVLKNNKIIKRSQYILILKYF